MQCSQWFSTTIVFTLCACATPKNDDTGFATNGPSNLNEEDGFESIDQEESADDTEENTLQDTAEQDDGEEPPPVGADGNSDDSDGAGTGTVDDDPDSTEESSEEIEEESSEEESSEEESSEDTDEASDGPIEDTVPADSESASGTTLVEGIAIPATLPPRGTSGTLTSQSEVAPSGTIADVVFSISLVHTCTKDLTATLTSPSGTSAVAFDLTSRPVCSSDMDETSLTDEASTPISSGTTPFVGAHKPTEPLSVFDGENAAGEWTLTIVDDTIGDTGSLTFWSLEIQLD